MQVLKLSDYSIFVGDIWVEFQAFLNKKKYNKIFILSDDNTEKHCFEPYLMHFPSENKYNIRILAGETQKNIETCQTIWQSLFEGNGDRKSLLINLGGGVIGDMGGFCASTYKRGIDFIQMPTTLLSQVDASIGGKLGIDFFNVKNSIGVFANPKAVFIHSDFLKTLPPREIRSGFAEIVKHALIADKKQWIALQKITDLGSVEWSKYLVPSLKIKQKVVKIDPFEKGLRKALNFGHTIGHAIESMALESDEPLTHGEAIAIGMICEAYLSHKIQGLKKEELDVIVSFILTHYPKYNIQRFDFKHLIDLMRQDKKNESADINFSFLPTIGAVEVNCTAPPQLINESLMFYQNLKL
jgi:3-dehydroquinate synthase